jgi:hypothetical protein
MEPVVPAVAFPEAAPGEYPAEPVPQAAIQFSKVKLPNGEEVTAKDTKRTRSNQWLLFPNRKRKY